MHPLLIESEHLVIPTYGIFYLLAYLSAIFMTAHLATRVGVPFWRMVDVGFQVSIAGELGARLTFVIVEWPRFREGAVSFREFLLAGRVVLGGVIVGVTVAAWLFRRHRFPVMAVLDATLASTALAMGIGRIGCLMAGCCFGRPTDMWWGITFTDTLAQTINGTPLDVSLHPTQILQSVDGFLVFLLLYWLYDRRRFDGQLVALFFAIEGVSRFLVEFLRGDPRGHAAGLATSQWIGLAMVVVGVAIWTLGSRRRVLASSG